MRLITALMFRALYEHLPAARAQCLSLTRHRYILSKYFRSILALQEMQPSEADPLKPQLLPSTDRVPNA